MFGGEEDQTQFDRFSKQEQNMCVGLLDLHAFRSSCQDEDEEFLLTLRRLSFVHFYQTEILWNALSSFFFWFLNVMYTIRNIVNYYLNKIIRVIRENFGHQRHFRLNYTIFNNILGYFEVFLTNRWPKNYLWPGEEISWHSCTKKSHT